MLLSSDRRTFIGTFICAAAGLSLSRAAVGQDGFKPLALTRLTDNLAHITGAGTNVVVLSGSEGLLLVNCGMPERSGDLMGFIASRFGGMKIAALFNTDWHLENTGSNESIGQSGAKIYAHENTRLWMTTEIDVEWQKRTYKPRPKHAHPNQTFYRSGKITFGNETIEYGYLPQAHTDGDIYVFFPGSNVLVAGEVVSASYPILDYTTGGWIGGMQEAMKALLSVGDEQTRIVPGAGALQTKAHLQEQKNMIDAMRERLVKLMRQGMGPDDMIAAAPSKDFDAKWGNPELFISNAYRGMWGHVRELGGIV